MFFEIKIKSKLQQYQQMAHFGGLCNNLMNSTTTTQILAFIQKEAGHLPFQRIQEFIRNLAPSLVNSNLDLFESFYRAIVAEYQIRFALSKDIKMQDVTSHIISIGSKVNQQLSMVLRNILQNRLFMESIKKSIEKNRAAQNSIVNGHSYKQKTTTVQIQSLGTGQNSVQNKTKQAFNFEVIKGPKNQQTNKLIQNKQTQICYNLENKPQCVCINQREIVTKDEFSFKCSHCYRLFHTVCFKRKPNSEYCSFCYIEKMIPVKKVIKTVYLGLLRKNVKKHYANIFIPVLENNQKLQVRCLRLKDGAQTSCLFPDITEILINNHKARQFEPINKQSCLKYRKDQPFFLLKGDYYSGQENSLIVNETLGAHKEKQIRYESQNHILAIFITEDLKIDNLIKEMNVQNVMGFSQSKAVLMQSFKLGKGDDQISCQLVKIPLSCPLSTNRIQIPARGIFCTHFQCFDLKNYLTFISQSQNPRWKCPLCPNLAYELQIDSITQQILKQNKDNQKIQQILFFKNGDYAPIVDDSPAIQRKNIRNLNIPEKKPKHEPPVLEEPPVRKPFLVPVNAQVIELDD